MTNPTSFSDAPRDPQAGFTLIEALVAMAILAVGAVSLLTATESHARRIGEVADRAAARWVAQARLAERRLGLEPQEGPVESLGRLWEVSDRTDPTDDPGLARLTVEVASPGGRAPLVSLVGYLDTGEPAADAGAAP